MTTADGTAGECDQKPGLQFTGRRTLPEKNKNKKGILLKKLKKKTFEASSGK